MHVARFTYLVTDIKLTATNIKSATRKLSYARTRASILEEEWQATIRVALAQGMSAVDVAEAAGISKARVYQIRDGRR